MITVSGSLDVGTHRPPGGRLARALDLARVALVVDMTGVDFCDSAGSSVYAQMYCQTR